MTLIIEDSSRREKIDLFFLFVYILAMFVQGGWKLLIISLLIVLFLMPANELVAQKKKQPLVLEELKIEGTIQKPEVMTILSRARFTYRTLDLDVSFMEKVEKAIHADEAF
jgi:ABC-type bacteriocin/lantibiotic exporter with double-glycine peptidase domain